MATYPEAITNGLRTIICSSLEFSENVLGYIGGAYTNVLKPGSSPNAPVGDVGFAYLSQQAAAQRGFYCDRKPEMPSPGFQGGQCAGDAYYFGYDSSWTKSDGNRDGASQQPQIGSNTVYGPIGDWYIRPQTRDPNKVDIVYPAFAADGSPIIVPAGTTFKSSYDFESTPLFIKASGPDNCGDAPPRKPTITNNNYSVDVDYINNEGNTVTISPTFSFGFFQVTPTLNLRIPFRVELPDVTYGGNNISLDGTLNLTTNEVNYNFGAGPPRLTDDPIATEPTEEDVVTTDPPPEPPPDDPTIPRIVGAVTVVDFPEATGSTVINRVGGEPAIWAPDLGTVSFLIRAGTISGWTEDIRIKKVNQYTQCPVPFAAVAVRGTPRPGATLTTYAIRDEVAIKLFPEVNS